MATRELDSPPGMLGLYAKAAVAAVPGAQMLPVVGRRPKEVPDLELRLDDAKVDRDRLAAYARVCGFTLRGTLPPTYPHIMAFSLHMALMTDGSFPFPAVGLVHVRNEITQHQPIDVTAALDITVAPTPIEPHPKGRLVGVRTEARVGGELVWEEQSTMLRRGGGSGEREEREPPPELPQAAVWTLPGDLGRRYAGVSGDRNPIHLYDITAKAFGFPRAIAHGMWTKARALAAMRLPDAFRVDVGFAKPVLLPAKVAFGERDGVFTVTHAKKGTLHLQGRIEER